MSKYRKSWTTAMQEVQESAALQLKMAFDDAGIKIKGTKGGKGYCQTNEETFRCKESSWFSDSI